ncbi:hypothetical protein [Serratia fonticola]|uniref:hypothetical protein n=1 Tax=Serratia fonticola TaxID=47917 RepID=UPI000E0EC54A|nr:hypothetical protein [Serratia fonticola]RDL26848.1 hypothetical protein DFO62_103259 [Serratia fonticola]
MNNQPLPPATLSSSQQPFCIHEKLKANNSHWSYAFAVSPIYGDAKYQLNTCLVGKVEFSVYKRVGNYFVLVDFSDDYNSMNEEAKKIIDRNPSAKASIMSWAKEDTCTSGQDVNQ